MDTTISFSLAFNFQKRLLASLVKSVKEGSREEGSNILSAICPFRKEKRDVYGY